MKNASWFQCKLAANFAQYVLSESCSLPLNFKGFITLQHSEWLIYMFFRKHENSNIIEFQRYRQSNLVISVHGIMTCAQGLENVKL